MATAAVRILVTTTLVVGVVWFMGQAVRSAKKGGTGMAALAIFLQFFSGYIPPPRQTVEDAREEAGKERPEDKARPKD